MKVCLVSEEKADFKVEKGNKHKLYKPSHIWDTNGVKWTAGNGSCYMQKVEQNAEVYFLCGE